MEKSLLLRSFFTILLAIFFLAPLATLFYWLGFFQIELPSDFFMALRGASLQAFLSSLVCLVGGLWGAMGLLWLRDRHEKIHPLSSLLVLIPGFLPPLLVVVVVLNLWNQTPMGLMGVVFFHSLMNIGLASVLLERLMVTRSSQWSLWARVEGLTFSHFLFRGVLRNMLREFFSVFVFLFLIFITSFSIPFLIAGHAYGGVEVLLYEQIFLFGHWGQAGITALVFSLLLLFLGGVSPKLDEVEGTVPRFPARHLLATKWGLIPLGLPVVMVGVGLLLAMGVPAESLMEGVSSPKFKNTLLLGVGTGLVILWLGSLLVYSFLGPKTSRYLFFFVPPGWMVVAFFFFLVAWGGSLVVARQNHLGHGCCVQPLFVSLWSFSGDRKIAASSRSRSG